MTLHVVLAVLAQALEDLWDNLFLVAGCSLLWLVMALLVIPGPPATVALVELVQRVHARESPGMGEYWRLIGSNFGLGWRWMAFALPVVLVLVGDLWAAPMLFADWLVSPVRFITSIALALWLVVLAYSLPLLFAQEEPHVLRAVRNGSIMLLRNPVFSLLLFVIAGLLLWVSLLLIVVNLVAGPMFVAFLATRAVNSRLHEWRVNAAAE